jgi:hypothetical protein
MFEAGKSDCPHTIAPRVTFHSHKAVGRFHKEPVSLSLAGINHNRIPQRSTACQSTDPMETNIFPTEGASCCPVEDTGGGLAKVLPGAF